MSETRRAVPIVQVDAFTNRPFGGNPAAVCVLAEAVSEDWMQKVGAEMNLSETAFLIPKGEADFGLRWFTPTVEVDLCGHATLASAHVLWEAGTTDADRIRFETRSGTLTARRSGDKIELDFPNRAPRRSAPPERLIEALGARPLWVGDNGDDILVELEDEAVVRELEPDIPLIGELTNRGLMITARGADYDFVSRFFAPAAGVDEDPVTGSAHCCLGPYWARRLKKDELVGYQASRRGGEVEVAVRGDRVLLRGHAVTVLRGELLA